MAHSRFQFGPEGEESGLQQTGECQYDILAVPGRI